MIIKERNPQEHRDTDKFSIAGAKAEEQMAFYLRRVFYDDPNIFVYNDLRFKADTGDVAQIDHLILHRHGFIVIESKSVSTGVAINEHGEWIRFWDRKPYGMPSPIQQVKMQIEFLRIALGSYAEELLDKTLFGLIQSRFKSCPFEIIVAISDQGSIKREINLPEVIKADQVPDKIKEIYQRHKKASSLFNVSTGNDGLYTFKDIEMQRISKFLLEHHYPLNVQKVKEEKCIFPCSEKENSSATLPVENPVSGLGLCDKCGTQSIILWGKYSYYWKCPKCGNNMSIKEFCPTCKEKLKLRKQKNTFFIYCEQCKTERIYYNSVEGEG